MMMLTSPLPLNHRPIWPQTYQFLPVLPKCERAPSARTSWPPQGRNYANHLTHYWRLPHKYIYTPFMWPDLRNSNTNPSSSTAWPSTSLIDSISSVYLISTDLKRSMIATFKFSCVIHWTLYIGRWQFRSTECLECQFRRLFVKN